MTARKKSPPKKKPSAKAKRKTSRAAAPAVDDLMPPPPGARAPPKRTRARGPRGPRVIDSGALMQAVSTALRRQGQTVGFVPTMGALHEGHLALIREARLRADVVVVSIFVNPKQFDRAADLSAYPRQFEKDCHACAAAGVDVVFAPTQKSIYPSGFETTVSAGGLGKPFEGKSRPGHFDGMLTVVTKLLNLVRPHFAVFGEKDYQQLLLVRRLVRDLAMPVEIVPMPVIREPDGLALSSRNARLSKGDRARATVLYRAVCAAQDAVAAGESRAKVVARTARTILKSEPRFAVDYCAVVDPCTLTPLDLVGSEARLVIAGTLGKRRPVRLLDNAPLFSM